MKLYSKCESGIMLVYIILCDKPFRIKYIDMKYKAAFLVFIIGVLVTKAQHTEAFFNVTDAFFKTHVANGKVDYNAIVEQPIQLNALMELAKNVSVTTEKPKEYQAFWINTYNLLVIKGIVDNYPLKSPLDVDGFFDKHQYNVGGKKMTLNGIENELLRSKFPNEPRFHFALVCAGLGCPPLINLAYMPEALDSQLQKQTVSALNNANFIKVNRNKVKISQLFEWYKEDFEQNGNVVDFINTYRNEKLPVNTKVSYYPYDWSLNELK